jgi:hypothetical protein
VDRYVSVAEWSVGIVNDVFAIINPELLSWLLVCALSVVILTYLYENILSRIGAVNRAMDRLRRGRLSRTLECLRMPILIACLIPSLVVVIIGVVWLIFRSFIPQISLLLLLVAVWYVVLQAARLVPLVLTLPFRVGLYLKKNHGMTAAVPVTGTILAILGYLIQFVVTF